LLIDLHSAGLHYEMPLLVGWRNDDAEASGPSGAAAYAFGTPFVWAHDRYGPGRTITVTADRGKPAIYAECAGGPAIDEPNVRAVFAGVLNGLALTGLLAAPPSKVEQPILLHGGGDFDRDVIRAAHGGFWTPTARAGDALDAGAPVGRISDILGNTLAE